MTKQISAYQKFVRITPRKLRLIADMVRGMKVETALIQLKVVRKNATEPVRKLITQAKANANIIGLRSETLIIKTIMIEEGPTFKRFQAVSRGRAHSILKRTSHLKVTLEGSDEVVVKHTSEKPPKTTTTNDTKKGE